MKQTPDAPHSIYGIEKWGKGLIEVTDQGEIGLRNPMSPETAAISLLGIISDLDDRGIKAPMVLRVTSYLEHEIAHLNDSFREAIARVGYKGSYRGVFPIKVNQQAQVVDRIVEFGKKYNYGLEAGSKPELVVALAHRLASEALIVCNGVKDAEFIQLAILSRKIGFNTVIVLESPKEADTVIKVYNELGIEPLIGVRVKLTNQISGKWEESSGDRSAFGMNTDQLVATVDKLRDAGLLHCLKLQHSHLGSQVQDVNDVRRAVGEACRYYTELTREGVPLTHLDLGGGMGVDYTGEKKAAENSINYTVEEYCANVVETVAYAMDEAEIDHPTLVTESGRAVVATSSMLVFNVLESTLYDAPNGPEVEPDDHHMVSDLAAVRGYLSKDRLQECWNDATFYRNELRALFRRGYVDLRQMARAERIYLSLMARLKALAASDDLETDVDDQLEKVADIYHCNFSLFQSLPDVWAIDQLHPIVPLQSLNRTPDRRAVLSDITCDSDGKIDRFILSDGVSPSLPVHSLPEDQEYLMGVFFVGAYQETLGDLHNLFGDTNVVTIDLRADGGFDLLHEQEGDTISEVLSYVEFDPQDCVAAFRKMVDEAISTGTLKAKDRKTLMSAYRDSINGYTYYE
ncbi:MULTISPECIES: biosynthetic arginine decarboxylase [unclassified Ruegeria]|uniref:biosynthetic arginine decarboxylase n=1 Tax=unclassified Ruegeria TaxID=2625375 RepID=UPI0014884669|nr:MULTISPECIES: biosynthetic arginine decarboxylase [unclassified Ruegeria]NOD35368.1 biosynthetic arginine decarboxylase [Ruegeria sp. HKCCD7296]NOD48984.1 biosynthetic arginine decarboxylase [Ruegeria sp. HKCCD5849]NOD53631.1 biosynthetic arginine decarboxylase [Ruegeria sp. HKCCD5851]NOD69506.1 biosynthetic arginine decarboxylase [Ruegeria sp. HKCCD7303]NOE42867.1 biosynthetic arginine decarboxylase [Ruegeria sp. HKCCD7319]